MTDPGSQQSSAEPEPVIPEPVIAPPVIVEPVIAESVITEPAPPQTTASGLPNPHGLPEIAVDRPEVALGAAFGGGLLLAMILKRFAR